MLMIQIQTPICINPLNRSWLVDSINMNFQTFSSEISSLYDASIKWIQGSAFYFFRIVMLNYYVVIVLRSSIRRELNGINTPV